MRILHISTRLILGGSQENTVLSCEGQARLGHEVHLAFGPIYGPEGSLLDRVQRFRTGDGRTIAAHVVPNMVRQIDPVKDFRAQRELRRLIERLRPDVVHTHSSKAGIIGRAAAWSSRPRPATVHTIHGPPFMPVEGGPLARLKIRAANLVYTLAERSAARRCHAIVSVADAMTQQFLARGIGRPDLFTTVRSGMETGPYLHPEPGEDATAIRAKLGLSPDRFVVGTVARLAQHKGHDDLLDALGRRLRAEPAWALLWVGDGWWRERLLNRAREMGLHVAELDRPAASAPGEVAAPAALRADAQIFITGLVPPDRIPGLMRAMDVLAHPSYREGLPRTLPQALLCGTPVVAYDADGSREVCLDPAHAGPDHATGRLVPVGNRAALRDAILWMGDHPAQRAAMAQRGRQRCARDFSAEHMVEQLEAVYARARAANR
jgi:glycosyltransferase involved in cell wall biosynthesis